MTNYEKILEEIGITLPGVPKPAGFYIPAKKVGNLVFSAGQGPSLEGKDREIHLGKVGTERTLEEGYKAARSCAIQCLAAIKGLIGSLDKIDEIVQVRGFVNSSADFKRHPEVINGASELLLKIFGEKGRHARTAVGVASLPSDITVELEVIVKIVE